MRLFKALIGCFIAVFWATPSWAINCAKAASEAEVAICADSQLMDSNNALELAYAQARKRLPSHDFATLRKAQRAWITRRDNHCAGSVSCLKSLTRERTAQIYESLRISNTVSAAVVESASAAEEIVAEIPQPLPPSEKTNKLIKDNSSINASVMSSLVLIVVTTKEPQSVKTYPGVTVATNTVDLPP